MFRYCLALFTLVAVNRGVAQAPRAPVPSRSTPAAKPRVPLPAAIAPAIALLDSTLSAAAKDTLRRRLPQDAICYHMGLGTWLRNEAGLWRGGAVRDSLRARGLRHPDDMSDLILRAYGLHLRGERIDLTALIRKGVQAPPGKCY